MAQLRIVERLMNIFMEDSDITTQRIALFSLGTMAVYQETRAQLTQTASPSVADVLQHCRDKLGNDEVLAKYCTRLKTKLKMPLQPADA